MASASPPRRYRTIRHRLPGPRDHSRCTNTLNSCPVPTNEHAPSPWRFCVAPMLDWTTSECRVFHRMLSRHARLYTEMVTTGAILHGDRDRHLAFQPVEQPVALQLGGSDPAALAIAARAGEDYGYDEINLNCGCPSDRVQNGRFGACLMAEPERVAEGVAAMIAAVDIPITVKCRLGIDELDSDEHLHRFIRTVAGAGCRVFIVHARKAWLQGLSPKQNREVPPLQYERVYALREAFPDLSLVLNGGIGSLDEASTLLDKQPIDGVMLGRAAYQDPWLLATVDQELFAAPTPAVEQRADAVEQLLERLSAMDRADIPARHLIRHILGLYNGQPGAKFWRRRLSQPIPPGQGRAALADALALVTHAQAINDERLQSLSA